MGIYFRGKMSTFGGPRDTGVTPDEGLALVDARHFEELKEYFLERQPPGTTGLARRLDPDKYYIACRWNYDDTSQDFLRGTLVTVRNPRNGRQAQAKPVDWGPNERTGRVADLSPGLASFLGLNTDNEVEVSG